MEDLELLRQKLEDAKRDLESKGFYLGEEGELMDLFPAMKQYEIRFQDCIEEVWPDKCWWQLTSYWDIFQNSIMSGKTADEVIEDIMDHIVVSDEDKQEEVVDSEEDIDDEYEDETPIRPDYEDKELEDDEEHIITDREEVLTDKEKPNYNLQDESLTEAPDTSVELGWMGKGKRHPVDPSEFTEFEKGTTVEVTIPAFTLHYKVKPGYAFDKEAQSDTLYKDVAVEFVLKDGDREAFVNHIKDEIEQSLLHQSGNEYKLRYYDGVWGDGLPLEPRLESKERFIKEEQEKITINKSVLDLVDDLDK